LIREVIYKPNASPDAEEVRPTLHFGQEKKMRPLVGLPNTQKRMTVPPCHLINSLRQ